MDVTSRGWSREWWPRSRVGVWLGFAVLLAVALADVALDSVVMVAPLVAAPLVAAGSASARATAAVAASSTATALALGWVDDIELSARHWVGIATTAAGGAIAVWLAEVRTQRERELRKVGPERDRGQKLAFALHARNVGSWSWDLASGDVIWDREMEALFGLAPGEFTGTVDDWFARLDPRDNELFTTKIDEMLTGAEPVRFDHRCLWPDGTVHWIECVGEAITVDGRAVTAVGLKINIDDRMQEMAERNRLLELERSARARSDYIALVNSAAVGTLALDEILARVTSSIVPTFADWCSIVVVADRPKRRPTIVYAHADPTQRERADALLKDHPYDPDAPFGTALVVRTGNPEFVRHLGRSALAGAAAALAPFAVRSAATVPLQGATGVLGAIQFVRTGDREFSDADLSLAVELGDLVAPSVANGVLFERQRRAESTFGSLQRFASQLNVATTLAEIREAVTGLDWATFGVDHATLLLENDERPEGTRKSGPGRLALPLVMMRRHLGTLVLDHEPDREWSIEERSTFETIADRCAGSIERGQLYESARDAALVLQRRLLSTLPELPKWLDAAAVYQPTPGGEVGGDWFQVLAAPGDRVVALVGDAVGHGLSAAAAMGQLRAAVAGAVAADTDPDRVLDAMERFARTAEDTMYASVACLLLDARPVVRFAAAGHVPPVWVSPGAPARIVEGGRRPLLGAGPVGAMPVSVSVQFELGDTLVLYTDGLVERRGEPIDLGIARLLSALDDLAGLSAAELCQSLIDRMTAGYQLDDDVALLVLRRTATR